MKAESKDVRWKIQPTIQELDLEDDVQKLASP
jgi:hypothetical protein